VVPVPSCAEELVTEPEDEDVLDHLLTKVMINAVKLILVPVGSKRTLELSGAREIFAKRLLDLFARG
jgi:hypothetical protein